MPQVVSIHAVVSAIAEGFSDAANKKGLTYTLTVDPSLPPTLLLQADMLPRLMQPLIGTWGTEGSGAGPGSVAHRAPTDPP